MWVICIYLLWLWIGSCKMVVVSFRLQLQHSALQKFFDIHFAIFCSQMSIGNTMWVFTNILHIFVCVTSV